MAGSFQIKRMGWTRMPTAWEQTMQWKEKQAKMKERLAQMESASSGLSAAAQNFISESGSLAVKAAISRNQAEAKARLAAAEKQQAELAWDEKV